MNTVRVQVVIAWPGRSEVRELEVPAGSSVRSAVEASRLLGFNMLLNSNNVLGVFSKVVSDEYPVRDGDRIEIYRPLQADAGESRRRRLGGRRR